VVPVNMEQLINRRMGASKLILCIHEALESAACPIPDDVADMVCVRRGLYA
jgi:hypothetical protein